MNARLGERNCLRDEEAIGKKPSVSGAVRLCPGILAPVIVPGVDLRSYIFRLKRPKKWRFGAFLA